MNSKPPSDLNALAVEALDLWQEHLSALAADPKARTDLAQLIEPSRQLFAEWMKKAQSNPHEAGSFITPERDAKDGAATVRPASDDGSLRLAQLALHVAELEKRVAKLESRKPRASRKTAGTAESR